MEYSTLYVIHGKIIKDFHVVEPIEKVELWHKRFSWNHISEKDMAEQGEREVLCDMRNSSLKKCDNYFVENKNIISFQTHSPRIPKILDLVHIHLCCPLKIRALGGMHNLWHLLMIIQERLRSTFWRGKMIFRVFSRNLRSQLNVKLWRSWSAYTQTMKMNILDHSTLIIEKDE